MMPGHDQIDRFAAECPSRNVLADLALGKLPGETIDTLGEHIESCPSCQRTLETFDGLEDSVVRDLKGTTSSDVISPNLSLDQQIQRAERLCYEAWRERTPEQSHVAPPSPLGPYELHEQIGRGGMGTVFRATHSHLKRAVAVKLLSHHRLHDAQSVLRFQREMEAVGGLNHTHLVQAYDAGEVDSQYFIAMELIDGMDLSRLVRRSGMLPVADACEVIRQAALGLQQAHAHGLIHRDVKPSNLMLTRAGTVKVLDLGLARLVATATDAEDEGGLTNTGKIVGTGDFLAPEQAQDTRGADVRSDIYSLGCTLYFLLTGQAPFSGQNYNTLGKKLLAHVHQSPPSIRKVRSDLPSGLVRLVDRMLAKNPQKRPQTAADVAAALDPFTAGNDLPKVLDRNSESPPVPRSHRRRPWWPWGLLVLLALVSAAYRYGGAIILFVQGDGVLIVTGETENVTLIAQPDDGESVSLEITNQHSIHLDAGKYAVRVSDKSLAIDVRPSRVTIQRGRTTVVTLHRSNLHARDEDPDRSDREPAVAERAVQLPETLTNSLGMPLRLIPAGEFLMGSPESEPERDWFEGPQHRVVISQPFYIGVHEVTQAEYAEVMGRNPSRFQPGGNPLPQNANISRWPVESVRWPEAVEFCERLSKRPAEKQAGRIYRLPTEAEWEYACRARTSTPFHYGDSLSVEQANYKGTFPYQDAKAGIWRGHPLPVGSLPPNEFGLYDMHGNVFEWCHDWFDAGYYHRSPVTDPQGPKTGEYHVLRSGGWGVNAAWCRSARRTSSEIAPKVFYSIGLRVVCEIPHERNKERLQGKPVP